MFVRGSVVKLHSSSLFYFNKMLSARVFYFRFKSVLPGVLREVTVPPRDQEVHLVICKEIQELILTQAIVRVDDFPSLCFSPIFVIPKKSGDLRVIFLI